MNATLLSLMLLTLAGNAFALTIGISAKTDGNEKPTVIGSTNLPDGVELMITLSRTGSAYMAQDKAKVVQGTFRAGPFSQKGSSLNPGTYKLEVSMPIAAVQPPVTWPVIGNEGAKLEGPLTKKLKFGGRVAEYKTTFRIGSGMASPLKDQAARRESANDKHVWWLKFCKDKCNMTSALATKRNETFEFDRCYYKCVADEPKVK